MRYCVPLLLCAAVAPASAQPPIQHRPHVHGATIIDVVQDGRDLNLSFELSGLDAVGFEHTPKSGADKSAVSATLAILQSPDEWLMPNAQAHCVRTFIGVTPHIFQTAHEDEPRGAAKQRRGDDYADIGVKYSFTCDMPLRLRTLKFDLIDRFPKLRAVIVNLTLPGAQSQAVITTPHAQITLAAAAADD